MLGRPVSVIELAGYRRRADELLTANEQDAVIDLIAYEPTCGDLISAPEVCARSAMRPQQSSGKRGRCDGVIYYFYNADFPLVLMALYVKNEKVDLTARDKKALAATLNEIMACWAKKVNRRPGRRHYGPRL